MACLVFLFFPFHLVRELETLSATLSISFGHRQRD